MPRSSSNPPLIGLILYVGQHDAKNLARVLESIRTQSLLPHHTRIVLGPIGSDILYSKDVKQAIYELKEFCPNVISMIGGKDKADSLKQANDSLADKDFNIMILMEDDIALPTHTFFHMSQPYLAVPNLLTVDAVVHDQGDVSWWKRFFARVIAKDFINGKFSVGGIGIVSAIRKLTARDNVGYYARTLWDDTHPTFTGDPKITLYY